MLEYINNKNAINKKKGFAEQVVPDPKTLASIAKAK